MTRDSEKQPGFELLRQKAEKILEENPPQPSKHEGMDMLRLIHELEVHQVELKMQNEHLVETSRKLDEALERYRELYDGAPVGYLTLTHIHTVIRINFTAAEMLRYSQSRLEGRFFPDFIHPEDKERFFVVTRLLMESTAKTPLEVRLMRGDGSSFHARLEMVRAAETEKRQNGFDGLHLTFMDITELKRTEEQLREARAEAERASQAKSRFLANMSHEIRTPISGLMGLVEMLLADDPPHRHREWLLSMKSTIKGLNGVIGDILDLSKIEAGKVELEESVFDLEALLKDTVSTFTFAAREKGVELGYRLDPDAPRLVQGDPGRLRQVFVNLIGNAVKFTDDGEIKIHAAEKERCHAGQPGTECETTLLFLVEDSGVGIPEEKQHLLFESFTQLDDSVSKRHGGTGLGLSISRRLVEIMGGQMWFKSIEGDGSQFWFTARFRRPENEAGPSRGEPGEPGQAARDIPPLKILVAEDELLNRMYIQHFLEDAGHEVVVATNGAEALKELERGGFDLVFMDIQMPEMDGLEAIQRIRRSAPEGVDPRIPIIALTAYAIKSEKERILEAGVDDYLSKPFEARDLHAAMANVLGRMGGLKPDVEVSGELSSLDLEKTRSKFNNDEGPVRKLAGIFLEQTPAEMGALEKALEAENLDRAWKKAHKLASSACMLYAEKTQDYARRLEKAARSGDLETANALFKLLREEVRSVMEALERNFGSE